MPASKLAFTPRVPGSGSPATDINAIATGHDALIDDVVAAAAGITAKVDKVAGKGLSTNDYTTAEQAKIAAISPVALSGSYADLTSKPVIPAAYTDAQAVTANTPAIANEATARAAGDTNLQGQATTNATNIAANASAITQKVDKATGLGLSSNDYTGPEKARLAVLANNPTIGYKVLSGLQRFRRGLGYADKNSAGVGQGGLDIVCYGDSILEGYNSTDPTLDSFVHRLKVKLQSYYNPSGVVGGYGFMAYRRGNSPQSLVTAFGVNSGNNADYSFNQRPISLSAGANGVYVHLNGGANPALRTAVTDVQFSGYQFAGYGNARWDVSTAPLGAAGIGTGTQTGTHTQAVGGGYHGGSRFGAVITTGFAERISLNPAADNYVQFAAAATGGDVSGEGLFLYNGDFTSGIRLHDASQYGVTVGQRLPFIQNFYGNNAPGFNTFGQGLLTGGSCNAKLYLFNFIVNDCGYSSTPGTPLATFLANYAIAIDYALALPSTPAVLLLISLKPTDAALLARTTVGERWEDFVAGIYGLCDARQNVAILDLNTHFGASAGLLDDHVHPGNTGGGAIAAALFKVLTLS